MGWSGSEIVEGKKKFTGVYAELESGKGGKNGEKDKKSCKIENISFLKFLFSHFIFIFHEFLDGTNLLFFPPLHHSLCI